MDNNNQSWYRLPAALLEDDRLTPLDAVVYAVLLDAGNVVRVAAQALANRCGVPWISVTRSLQRLRQYGYITWQTDHRQGNLYTLADIIPPKRRKDRAAQEVPAPKPVQVPATDEVAEREPEAQQQSDSDPAEQGQLPLYMPYGQYGHVRLTLEQAESLRQELGGEKLEWYIQRLDSYIEQTGKHYQNCACTIRRWVQDDLCKDYAPNKRATKSTGTQATYGTYRQARAAEAKEREIEEDMKKYLAVVNRFNH